MTRIAKILWASLAWSLAAAALAPPVLAQRGGPREPGPGRHEREPNRDQAEPSRGVSPRPTPPGPARPAAEPPRSSLGGFIAGGLSSPRPGVEVFRATPGTYGATYGSPGPTNPWMQPVRPWHRPQRPYTYSPYPYAIPVYPYLPPAYTEYSTGSSTPAPTSSASAEPTGFLRLAVSPRRANVLVDGVYEGTVDDFGGTGERTLRAGLHRVRLEADGHEPVEFDVRIPAGDTITLRRDLDVRAEPSPAPPQVAAAAPAGPAKPTYVIPRCYLGNTRPAPETLPAGCSLSDLRVLR